METMFNTLSVLTALGVLVCLVYVRRLRKYVASPSWTYKECAFIAFILSQFSSLINIGVYGGGLSKLGLLTKVLQLVGIGLLALSYATLGDMFKGIVKKFRLKIPMKPE